MSDIRKQVKHIEAAFLRRPRGYILASDVCKLFDYIDQLEKVIREIIDFVPIERTMGVPPLVHNIVTKS